MQEIIAAYYDFWFGMNEVYEQWAKKRGLTANGLFVLYAVHQQESCTQRMICEQLLLPKQTVNTILDGFERKGYLYRAPSAEDKRSKRIVLTEAGQAYTDGILAELAQAETAALSAMTAAERQSFIRTSHLFLRQLRAAFAQSREE